MIPGCGIFDMSEKTWYSSDYLNPKMVATRSESLLLGFETNQRDGVSHIIPQKHVVSSPHPQKLGDNGLLPL